MAVTAIITRLNIAALAALVFGIAMAALAIPRVGAGLASASANMVSADAAGDEGVVMRRQVLDWADDPTAMLDLAAAILSVGDPTKVGLAQGYIAQSLSIAPLSPYGWALLANAKMRQGEPRQAVRALLMSFVSGRYSPNIFEWRLAMTVALAPYYEAEDLATVKDQIAIVWDASPKMAAAVAVSQKQVPFVRALLDEAEREEFDRLVAKEPA